MSHSPSRLFEKRHLFYDQPRPFANCLLQICKLFDGLFIGNHHAGKEHEFLTNNKISLVVNLAPNETHPHPVKHITLLTYDLAERKGTQELALALPTVLEIIAAMENTLRVKHESVVIIAKQIDSRVLTFACLYLMVKFRWTCQEALAFVHQRFPDGHVLPAYLRLLEAFGSHRQRDKLSEAFETDQTPIEKQLLMNTVQNSHVINMPNFHGLTLQKKAETQAVGEMSRKVRFKKDVEIINGSLGERRANSHSASKQVERGNGKLASVQSKLRQFIKEKCGIVKETSNINMKSAPFEEDNDIVFIKSKDILCRIPRRRAASKTQESPFINKKQRNSKEKSPADEQDIFQFKEDESLFKKSNPLKMVFPFDIDLREGEQQGLQSHRRQKNYVVHNSKRYRLPKKCYTQESITSSYLEPDKYRRRQKQETEHRHFVQPPGSMFKISKSSKNSSKKIKINTATINALGKDSEKCIKIMEEGGQSGEESAWQGNHRSQHKIINFNLNVQIENINVIREKRGQQKKPRMFTRPHHVKKYSKALSSISHNDT